MFRRIVPYLVIIVMLSLITACSNDDDGSANAGGAEPQSSPMFQSQAQGTVRTESVEIAASEVKPGQINLTAGVAAQLEIKNSGTQPCSFFLGEYARNVQVPAGETVKQSLTLQTTKTDTVQFGCDGDIKRQGSAIIEFKGVGPTSGR